MDLEQTMTTSELLTTSKIARLMGVSVGTIKNWRRHGIGPPWVRVGSRHLYNRQAALDWLASQQDSPEPKEQDQ
jgi:DNA-binding transcriptional MerR regulator